MNYFYIIIIHILKRSLQLFLLVFSFGTIGQIILEKSEMERGISLILMKIIAITPILIFYFIMLKDRIEIRRNRNTEIEE
ncbi:hypothetical protein DVK85_08660 [Flavobacterium arcticum]|uniref:Uncharacterized protein n=1 Tax=Flavobacterium arcticum TaxID=1784713 RepID=A0A345HCI6_9FLAO|nr:hypothetical protein DVK85_08660 [Flavobacterium arcticum]